MGDRGYSSEEGEGAGGGSETRGKKTGARFFAPPTFALNGSPALAAVRDDGEDHPHRTRPPRSQPLSSPTPSLVNALLLAASLVAKTWSSIGQEALLRHGLVTPSGLTGFLEQLEARGMTASLAAVRYGAGGRNAGDEAMGDPGTALVGLVDRIPAMDKLDLVGGGIEHSGPIASVRRRESPSLTLIAAGEVLNWNSALRPPARRGGGGQSYRYHEPGFFAGVARGSVVLEARLRDADVRSQGNRTRFDGTWYVSYLSHLSIQSVDFAYWSDFGYSYFLSQR